MAGIKDLYIEQGATYKLAVKMKHADGTPFDLTDWTIQRGQIRKTRRSDTVVKSFTITVENAAQGEMTVSLSAEDSASIPAGETVSDPRSKYVYDIEIENGVTGEVMRILEGFVYISPEVTR